MKTVIDSSVVIDYLDEKGDPRVADRVDELVRLRALATNVIVRYEVLFGEKPGSPREQKAQRLVGGKIPCRILHRTATERALELGRQLQGPGGGGDIGTGDTLIAAMALHHGDAILTSNRSDFERVPDLRIDPAST